MLEFLSGHLIISVSSKEEQNRIKEEVGTEFVSVIFDGTSRLGQALTLVLRFVGLDWTIVQRLFRVQLLAKSLSGEEIAHEIISVSSTAYGIGSNQLLACMRDGASTNTIVLHTLPILYHSCDVKCFSHALDWVGEHFDIPVLEMNSSAYGLAIVLRHTFAGASKQAAA